MGRLWTPDRDIELGRQRGVKEVAPQDMELFARMHKFAQENGIVLVCGRCDESFRGFNAEQGRTWSVQCGCREIKSTVRKGIVV